MHMQLVLLHIDLFPPVWHHMLYTHCLVCKIFACTLCVQPIRSFMPNVFPVSWHWIPYFTYPQQHYLFFYKRETQEEDTSLALAATKSGPAYSKWLLLQSILVTGENPGWALPKLTVLCQTPLPLFSWIVSSMQPSWAASERQFCHTGTEIHYVNPVFLKLRYILQICSSKYVLEQVKCYATQIK